MTQVGQLKAVVKAIVQNTEVGISYNGGTHGETKRFIKPESLERRANGKIYIGGHCCYDDTYKVFLLDRLVTD
jgi:predicted DNA-binding transcriptional regulator YafY